MLSAQKPRESELALIELEALITEGYDALSAEVLQRMWARKLGLVVPASDHSDSPSFRRSLCLPLEGFLLLRRFRVADIYVLCTGIARRLKPRTYYPYVA